MQQPDPHSFLTTISENYTEIPDKQTSSLPPLGGSNLRKKEMLTTWSTEETIVSLPAV